MKEEEEEEEEETVFQQLLKSVPVNTENTFTTAKNFYWLEGIPPLLHIHIHLSTKHDRLSGYCQRH